MSNKKIMLSGIQPTNDLTLGNYLGAIVNFVKFQEEFNNIVFIADLHAITSEFKTELNQASLKILKFYLAAGLDPKKTLIFKQSDVLEHTFLSYLLMCNTTIGELNRMTQFKDKSSKIKNANGTEFIPTGLLIYPTLMAADILLYDADVVVVGSDQKQHLELTRNIATRVNNKLKQDIFKLPEPYIAEVGARIMDLADPTKKMSKSTTNKKGVIFLSDSEKDVEAKIKSALTDNLNQVKYDVENQPGVSNLISIYHVISKMSIADIEKKYANIENYGVFKKDLIALVNNLLKDLQTKYNSISDADALKILAEGKEQAKKIASDKVALIKNKMEM